MRSTPPPRTAEPNRIAGKFAPDARPANPPTFLGGAPPLLVGVAAILLVLGLDAFYRRTLPLPLAGPVDWVAHAATTALFLVALYPRPSPTFAAAALVSTVLIDLDHVPHIGATFVLGHEAPGHGWWLFHTLLALAAVGAIALLWPYPWRRVWLGVAFGLATHLVRNAASGEGIPLFLPLSARRVAVSYEAYVLVLVALVAIVLRRWLLRRRRADRMPAARI